MTRDTYDVTVRRASQLSQKLELFRSSSTPRRPSQMVKRSLLHEADFRGSDRTLVSSSLDSNNSSRSNVHTSASSSSYTDSRTDINSHERANNGADDDDDDEDDDGINKPEELETDKGLWDRKLHYVMLGFGVVFGVRNILEFPALAVEHGGGAFLFTYVLLTFTVGLPIIYLEVSLGQYTRGGAIKAWRILPLAKGIGVCSWLLSLSRTSYTYTPAAWALYHLYAAVAGLHPLRSRLSLEQFVEQHSNSSSISSSNLTAFYHLKALNVSSDFFYTNTLMVTDSISSTGQVVTHIIISLIILWIFIFSISALSPAIMGKISFLFTAVPSVLLFILFIAVCTMTGSVQGIRAFLNPRWYRLAYFKPWLDALDLVLSSLASGTGVIITLSGHCKFHGNTFRNAMSMTSLSVIMTVLSGCLMLSLLGVESRLSGVMVENVTHRSDVDLGFVLLPAVTSNLSTPAFWNGTFYLSIVLFSVIQAAVMSHHLQQGVIDLVCPDDVKRRWKLAILGALAFVLLSLNVLTTAQNGLHILRILQLSVPRLATPLLCAAECLVIGWGYGARRFAGRVTEMTGRNKSFIWKWLWRWGCPVILSLVAVLCLLTTNLLRDTPEADHQKKWLHGIGWCLTPAILLPGAAMTVVSFFSVPGTFKQRVKQLRSTPSSWGPGHPEHEPQADLPDYVICHPDPFRPANALAMLTANLYLPNIVNFVNMQGSGPDNEMAPGYLSDVATLSSSDDESGIDAPPRKDGFFGRCQATVSCLSHVIGLGNVVRFPYLAYQHDGGAFVLAYVIVLLTCGLPLFIIETAVGQFSNLGTISVWRAVPLFKGIGFSMVLISVVTSIYYGVMTSWAVYYLATSLTSVMPWQTCMNNWNTNSCRIVDTSVDFCQNLSHHFNASTPPPCPGDGTDCVRPNATATGYCPGSKNHTIDFTANSSTSTEEYFYLSVVRVSQGWNDVGQLRWQLALCLLMTWTMVFLFLIKGCRPGGKATYLILSLTSTTLLILLIRSSSLMGGHDGLRHLFTPKWSKLTSGHVWRDAASQVFFSLSLGSGSVITVATYNKFTNNVFREAALVCLLDTSVSLLASLVIFAVVGALGRATGLGVEAAAQADLGLTYVTLSHATMQLPWPLFWAILTFLMLVTCGVFTCAATMATAITAVMDVFSTSLKKQRVWLLLFMSLGALVLGLPMIVQVGFYVVDGIDTHMSGLPQVFVGGATILALIWIYGIGRFCGDISRMVNSSIGWWWRLVWVLVTPCLIACLLVTSIVSLFLWDDHSQPWWVTLLGTCLWSLLTLPIFIALVHEVVKTKGAGLVQKLQKACQPRKGWGATLHRCTSNIEYYPTVHTHLGLDINREGLNTITDHVEFTTVGVRVPSLSQTTLLPVSPSVNRTKRPMDMRHKAILNHAYSNPQCNISSGSLEKIGRRRSKRFSASASTDSMSDVIVMKRSNKKINTCTVSTQTDAAQESKLYRQRSQPMVHVTKPIPMMTRSLSWHQIPGQPAILEVNTRQHSKSRLRGKLQQQKTKATPTERHRRYGLSVAPDLTQLMDTTDVISQAGGRGGGGMTSAHVTADTSSGNDNSSAIVMALRGISDVSTDTGSALSVSRLEEVSIPCNVGRDMTTCAVLTTTDVTAGPPTVAAESSGDTNTRSGVCAGDDGTIAPNNNNNNNNNNNKSNANGSEVKRTSLPSEKLLGSAIEEHDFKEAFFLGKKAKRTNSRPQYGSFDSCKNPESKDTVVRLSRSKSDDLATRKLMIPSMGVTHHSGRNSVNVILEEEDGEKEADFSEEGMVLEVISSKTEVSKL